MSTLKIKNKLAAEKSPYLLQHSDNPVAWYPWGEEAFQLAKKENKPIFLSIGYSTCHWCHVMADESLYNIDKEGNFTEESTGEKTGKNILYLKGVNEKRLLELLKQEEDLKEASLSLYKRREKRVHPEKDDKILTDWNGLVIAALAKAAFVFKNGHYLDLAEDTANFILENLIRDDSLLHRFKDGERGIKGTINDYAFLIWGLLELYQASFKTKYLNYSIKLNKYFCEYFWDEKKGGFFFVSEKDNDLILQNKEFYDGALPSGNSVALCNLINLAHLTGDHRLDEIASDLVKIFSDKIKTTPTAYTHALNGIQSSFLPYYDLIIVGTKKDKITKEIMAYLRENYRPNLSILLIPEDDNSEEYHKLAQNINYIEDYKQVKNKTTIYICKDYSCSLPVTTTEEALQLLE